MVRATAALPATHVALLSRTRGSLARLVRGSVCSLRASFFSRSLSAPPLLRYVPKVGGEPPLPRFGHSSTLVESQSDQSRKLYIFGGHDGESSRS